jgi:hypothetical protein
MRSPGFVVFVLLTFSLGAGALMAVHHVIDRVSMRMRQRRLAALFRGPCDEDQGAD